MPNATATIAMTGAFYRDSDPIETSSPTKNVYNSGSDDNDSLFDDMDNTIATVPYNPTEPVSQKISHMVPSSSPPPASYMTQPTQVITPQKKNHDTVKVPETSPPDHSSGLDGPLSPKIPERLKPTVMRTIGSMMAPPGTQFRPPTALPSASQISLSEDPPIEPDSEDELALRDSDIKPTKWSFGPGSQGQQRVPSFGNRLQGFNYEPRKRPIDDMASAYSNSTRLPKQARQNGPSRAQPIETPDLTINEIADFRIREKIGRIQNVLPNASVSVCNDALFRTRGHFEDAMGLVSEIIEMQEENANKANAVEISDDEHAAPRKGVAQTTLRKQPTMKQGPSTSKQNIHDRWKSGQRPLLSSQQVPARSQDTAEEAPRRRKLVQGRRTRSSSPQEPIEIDSGNESAAASISPEPEKSLDDELLHIFNTSTPEDIADLCLQPEEVVQIIIENRPFKSLLAVRKLTVQQPTSAKKRGKAIRGVGDKIVDAAQEMYASFKAVDDLVEECSKLGTPLADEMKKWGVDVYGSRAQGDAEFELVNFEDLSDGGSSAKDSGIGTPTGTPPVAPKSSHKTNFIKKPSIMADDLELKDYQLVGLNWLALLWSQKRKLSGLLADEMGLGKTCQVITFLSHLREIGVKGPHLIIVTSSTVENWLKEFDRFSPSLDVRAYHGAQADRVSQRYEIMEQRDEIDVVVTTYDMVRSEDDSKFLRKKLQPVVAVYDEAHALKNSSSQRYTQLMRVPAQMRILLTGTPVQNNLNELVSLLGFLMPDVFEEHQEDLAYLFKYKAKTTDKDHSALLSARRIQRARTMMAPFILRRKKVQVLKHLPPKTTRVEYCELTESQQELYDRLMGDYDEADADKKKSASSMMKLRQTAIHKLMLQEIYDGEIWDISVKLCDGQEGKKQERKYHQLFEFSDGSLNKLCHEYNFLRKYALDDKELLDSGKVQKMLEILKEHIANGDRTLLFSQFTSALDILEGVFEKEQIKFARLDGSTKVADRQTMIDDFNSDPTVPVFMLSTKAGGVGINLASANKVIIFDSSFNPQEDQQAMDRAHRVGQTRPVEVISLVTKGTIEEDIYALGTSKLALDSRLAAADGDDDAKVEKKNEATIEQKMKERIEQRKLEQSAKKNRGKDAKDVFSKAMKKKGFDMSAA